MLEEEVGTLFLCCKKVQGSVISKHDTCRAVSLVPDGCDNVSYSVWDFGNGLRNLLEIRELGRCQLSVLRTEEMPGAQEGESGGGDWN